LAFDSAGNLYVGNDGIYTGGLNGTIVRFTPGGVGSVFATGLSDPGGLAFDSQGNLYVANTDYRVNTIEKFTSAGVGTLFASTGLNNPVGLAFDSAGNLYAASSANSTIVKFTPDGVGSVFASNGLSGPTFITIIPEPSTLTMLGFGFPVLLAFRRPKGRTSVRDCRSGSPNKSDSPNPAMTSLFQIERHRRRVGDLRR
jgi:hypothetical protein